MIAGLILYGLEANATRIQCRVRVIVSVILGSELLAFL